MATALILLGASCGGSGDDAPEPDEATFCRLAEVHAPVAEADAEVLRRLDELAPDDIDAAVVVLREAAEELEDLTPNSPDAIAAEFDIRFRPDYSDARDDVETFVASECTDETEGTTTTSAEKDR